MPAVAETLDAVRIATEGGYRLGFETDLAQEIFPAGRDEATVRALSARKDEPAWLLEWRLKAFWAWQAMEPPLWAAVRHPPIDFQAIRYFAAPKGMKGGEIDR